MVKLLFHTIGLGQGAERMELKQLFSNCIFVESAQNQTNRYSLASGLFKAITTPYSLFSCA